MYGPSSITALSAPGKVLLTGGYLVLDREYTGTVFALDARIHAVVQQLRKPRRPSNSVSGGNTGFGNGLHNLNRPLEPAVDEKEYEDKIIVRSPQFLDAAWEYSIQHHEEGGGVSVVQKGNG